MDILPSLTITEQNPTTDQSAASLSAPDVTDTALRGCSVRPTHRALVGKFWLTSLSRCRALVTGADKTCWAAWKLRSNDTSQHNTCWAAWQLRSNDTPQHNTCWAAWKLRSNDTSQHNTCWAAWQLRSNDTPQHNTCWAAWKLRSNDTLQHNTCWAAWQLRSNDTLQHNTCWADDTSQHITGRLTHHMTCWLTRQTGSWHYRFVFQDLLEPNRACLVGVYAVTLDPLLSLYGIIYVTWYTKPLPKPTGVRFRQLSVYQVMRLPNTYQTRPVRPPKTYLSWVLYPYETVVNHLSPITGLQ